MKILYTFKKVFLNFFKKLNHFLKKKKINLKNLSEISLEKDFENKNVKDFI